MTGPALAWIEPDAPPDHFPPVEQALKHPNGLLAAGGNLSIERLLAAYQRGIFPWYSEGEPILWWSPDPRCVFYPDRIHISRRLRRTLRQGRFQVTFNRDFAEVVHACAAPRPGQHGTWLLPEMREAYIQLYRAGHAQSVEVWQDGILVGGLYGVAMGKLFCAESMFSRVRDASKIALIRLGQNCTESGIELIDAQIGSPHLYRMGAVDISRVEFQDLLALNR